MLRYFIVYVNMVVILLLLLLLMLEIHDICTVLNKPTTETATAEQQ